MADARRAARRFAKRLLSAAGRRSPLVKRLTRSMRARRRADAYRALCARTPIEPTTVLFESYVGSSFACSPKALYEAMLGDARFDGHTLIWAFQEPAPYQDVPELERAVLVKSGSPEHTAALARAKYWIVNCAVPPHVAPRGEQVYLQTWHGTPLKRFGCDITIPSATTKRAIHERLGRWHASAAKFTHLLSQSPFASEKLVSALGLDPASAPGVVLELGYPRNDFLNTYTEADVERIRARLGIPAGKRVVLYAPTWRDEQRAPGEGRTVEPGLDFERLRTELGDDYVVLFRAHFMVADSFDFERSGGFVHDVSRVDDVNELYVVSDVLVTDYSSVFFDFATLRRPVVFYMYDLEQYSSDRGGFYLDLEELPGPIVREQAGLTAAVLASESPEPDADERFRAFSERFAARDDGHASRRVLDRVLRPKEDDWHNE